MHGIFIKHYTINTMLRFGGVPGTDMIIRIYIYIYIYIKTTKQNNKHRNHANPQHWSASKSLSTFRKLLKSSFTRHTHVYIYNPSAMHTHTTNYNYKHTAPLRTWKNLLFWKKRVIFSEGFLGGDFKGNLIAKSEKKPRKGAVLVLVGLVGCSSIPCIWGYHTVAVAHWKGIFTGCLLRHCRLQVSECTWASAQLLR